MASVLGLCVWPAVAQWTLQNSGSAADLRGIDSVGGDVAWASGSHGTVLRTEDKGRTWQRCATPHGAEQLDFRGVQAFDAMTAIVMSSGKGELSRLYKTADGCKTWKLLLKNPDKDGFWDAVKFLNAKVGFVLGDPITRPFNYSKRKDPKFTGFALLYTEDAGKNFAYRTSFGNESTAHGQGAFAASNSVLCLGWPALWFGTGGTNGPRVYLNIFQQHIGWPDDRIDLGGGEWRSISWPVPLAQGESAGVFSVAMKLSGRTTRDSLGEGTSSILDEHGVIVGGDYKYPNEVLGTAASTVDGGRRWAISVTPPHGYRSAVTYDKATDTWITVGPNGTDVSTDDGKNWRPLKPGPGDDPEADQHWNALSLPFVVGPKGRIGVLRGDALRTIATPKER